MGITVISALPGNPLPGIAPAGGGADPGASGGFAALLSGELLGQTGMLSELGGSIARQLKDLPAAEDKPAIENNLDASLLASLFGHPASAEMSPGSIAPTAVGDSPQLRNGGSAQVMPEPLAVKANPRETGGALGGVLEKLMGNGKDAAAAPSLQAANIAVETEAGEKPVAFASHLAASGLSASAASHAANTAQPGVAAPLHSPAWPQQFSDRIVWLARNDQQTAQLNINPPQLGPIQITVNLNGDQAHIAFASPHAEVRQAIEGAMPQLRDMLSAAGINLGQANVGPNLQQQHGDTPFGNAEAKRFADENAILPANEKEASAGGATIVQRGRGLVDLFA